MTDTSACNAWAVGFAASPRVTLVERWNGKAWKVQKSPNPSTVSNELQGVAAVSSSEAWAVGYSSSSPSADQTLVERWNGKTWKVQTSPNPSLSDNELSGVTAVSSSDAWAVGRSLTGTDGWNTLIEHWNGKAWKVQKSPSPSTTDNELYGVTAVSPSDIWAVGLESNGAAIETLILHWNGKAWKVQKSANASTSDNELRGVTAASSGDVWAVGFEYNGTAQQTLVERWNGKAWKVQKSHNPGGSTSDNELYGVAAVSSSDAWAVGYEYNGTAQQTLVERWNGSAWKVQKSPNPGGSTNDDTLNGVAAVSSSDVWAVGSYIKGTLQQTLVERWNGKTWKG